MAIQLSYPSLVCVPSLFPLLPLGAFISEEVAFDHCCSGHESRRGESVSMKKMMAQLGLKIVEMVEPGRLDGGDVLFTGKEFFVGISSRTSEVLIELTLLLSYTSSIILQDGISQLAAAFPAYSVTGIPVQGGLHLKSFMSMAGPNLVAIGTSPCAKAARKLMEEKGSFQYSFMELPDDVGANCLYLNGTIVHASRDVFPKSCEKFEELDTLAKKVAISLSEMNKVDGCFTCCCVLVK